MGDNPKTPLTPNQKVLVWTRGQLGKTVGRGECWDLGEQALQQAGAQTSNDLGPVADDADYIWGNPTKIKDVEPGDILQIRDLVITTTTVSAFVFPDGTSQTETSEESITRAHHTAIVDGKLDADGSVKSLEQNVEPKGKIVQTLKINTRDVPEVVKVTSEKAVNPKTKKTELAKVTRKVSITVTGDIWPYKPKPK